MLRGPGLAKIRRVRLVRERQVRLLALVDGAVASLLARADVMSEGAIREEGAEARYYGSTDLRLDLSEDEQQAVVRLLGSDPHARLRVLRIAHREACSRASSPLGTLRAEIAIDRRGGRVSIHVEVEAPVLHETRARKRVVT
jgi:hypothetical protein